MLRSNPKDKIKTIHFSKSYYVLSAIFISMGWQEKYEMLFLTSKSLNYRHISNHRYVCYAYTYIYIFIPQPAYYLLKAEAVFCRIFRRTFQQLKRKKKIPQYYSPESPCLQRKRYLVRVPMGDSTSPPLLFPHDIRHQLDYILPIQCPSPCHSQGGNRSFGGYLKHGPKLMGTMQLLFVQ